MAPKLYLMQASPPCRAVLMVAKAIGLELDIEEVDKEALRTPEMLELNPQHTVPILVDDDFVVWDSHAIAGYLVGQYGEDDTLYPKNDIRKRAVIDQRLHFENGVLYERCRTASVSPLRDQKENRIICNNFGDCLLYLLLAFSSFFWRDSLRACS
jgi:glutathione S-transferase